MGFLLLSVIFKKETLHLFILDEFVSTIVCQKGIQVNR